ncbi:MAG: hypothetical protein ACK4FZ_09405 [Vogesella sp.]|uniref:hypothetical protein n=1 Tax=Vogesella sp. TaxID=1904252 RepID=UPI00391AC3BB
MYLLIGWCVLWWSAWVHADDMVLRVMSRATQGEAYFHGLLGAAMSAAGSPVRLQPLQEMPNARAELLLQQGKLDLHWFVRTAQRDKQFLRVDVPLTEGMMGRRVLMVPPKYANEYVAYRSLQDVQQSGKVAAMAHGWADIAIWQYNGLPVSPQRLSVPELYRLVAQGGRGMHYFPRSVIEIETERDHHAGLVPARGIMLVYAQDCYFYVSPRRPELQRSLQLALQQAQASGLRQRLFRQHYAAALSALELDKRHVLKLKLPASS